MGLIILLGIYGLIGHLLYTYFIDHKDFKRLKIPKSRLYILCITWPLILIVGIIEEFRR